MVSYVGRHTLQIEVIAPKIQRDVCSFSEKMVAEQVSAAGLSAGLSIWATASSKFEIVSGLSAYMNVMISSFKIFSRTRSDMPFVLRCAKAAPIKTCLSGLGVYSPSKSSTLSFSSFTGK